MFPGVFVIVFISLIVLYFKNTKTIFPVATLYCRNVNRLESIWNPRLCLLFRRTLNSKMTLLMLE